MLRGLHGFLPPHPGPASVAATFHASLGPTLFYGLLIAVPATALTALARPRLPFVRRMNPSVPTGLVGDRVFTDEEMPGMGWSLSVALPLTLAVAIRAFGPRMGRSLDEVSASCRSAAQAMAMILLVIGAGGAFEQVIVDGGISDYIKHTTDGIPAWQTSRDTRDET